MSNTRLFRRLCAAFLTLVLLAGCAGNPIQRKDGRQSTRPFGLANLAKADVDMVCELTQQEVLASLRRLTLKLYRRNPQEFRKAGFVHGEAAAERIFGSVASWRASGLDRVDWAESLRLAFADGYAGDRVHAFMLGVTVMVMASYEHRTEFYVTDSLDAQRIYNSARNLEAAVWKLAQARSPAGAPYLLSNGLDDESPNLSFEREFGKVIAQQDLLAVIIEDKTNRAINRLIHNVASFVLLPV